MTPKATDVRKVPTAGTPTVAKSRVSDSGVTASSRYTPPVPAKVKGPSPMWVPVLLFGLLPELSAVYETGMCLSGSTNGLGTTVAVRGPHSVSTLIFVPLAAISVGSQQYPMFFFRRGE